MQNAFLVVREVTKRYGDAEALKGVNLDVAEGEVFGLLGPNGAGKTTLLSILSCLVDPTGGEIYLDGRRVVRSDRDVRRLIGIVPQELAIYQELTARENLRFVGQLYGIGDPKLKQRVTEILELIGLADRADKTAKTYSGGMKRRLNLGLALLHKPKLLLLDEPTTGVDPQSRNHLFEGVRRLNSQGITIIYTSHYMEEVQALCSRIGIIDHGLVIACNTLKGLLTLIPGRIRFCPSERPEGLLEELRSLVARPNDIISTESADQEVDVNYPGGTATPVLLKQRTTESTVRMDDDGTVLLETANVTAATVQLVSLLKRLNVELKSLEVEPPNLERVFLELTGKRLRD